MANVDTIRRDQKNAHITPKIPIASIAHIPEISPIAVGHIVSRPTMGDFVRHNIGKRAITRKQRCGEETTVGILHAAVRE